MLLKSLLTGMATSFHDSSTITSVCKHANEVLIKTLNVQFCFSKHVQHRLYINKWQILRNVKTFWNLCLGGSLSNMINHFQPQEYRISDAQSQKVRLLVNASLNWPNMCHICACLNVHTVNCLAYFYYKIKKLYCNIVVHDKVHLYGSFSQKTKRVVLFSSIRIFRGGNNSENVTVL